VREYVSVVFHHPVCGNLFSSMTADALLTGVGYKGKSEERNKRNNEVK
jgi:hypothetical protein